MQLDVSCLNYKPSIFFVNKGSNRVKFKQLESERIKLLILFPKPMIALESGGGF